MRIVRVLLLAGLLVGASVAAPGTSAQPAAAGGPTMSIAVTPDPMPKDTDAYVSVLTSPGVSCYANVIYVNGQVPTMFQNSYHSNSYRAASNGVIAWLWHQDVNASAGWALAVCTQHGRVSHAAYFFAITS